MPDPTRVLADFQGPDSLDAATRQMVALSTLHNIVTSLARPGSDYRRFTPEENELMARYVRAENHIDSTHHLLHSEEWVERFRRYYGSGTFFRALVHRYLSACNRDRLFEVLRAQREARRN